MRGAAHVGVALTALLLYDHIETETQSHIHPQSTQTPGDDVIGQPLVPLESLSAGEAAQIVRIDGALDHVCRLNEMGLQPGIEVRMVRPGYPCILAVGNHRLSFRSAGPASIWVQVGARNHVDRPVPADADC